jgi:hypothetical protein
MTRSCCPSFYGIVQIVARTAAWMTSVTTLVILAFIINQWPDKGGAIAAGLVGVSLSLYFSLLTSLLYSYTHDDPGRVFLHWSSPKPKPDLMLCPQSAIAILNDSWIVVANIDRALGFQQLSPARALLHDLFSLAVSLGGIVMIIFSRYSDAADGFAALDSDSAPQVTAAAGQTDVISREGFSQVRMMAIAVWLLTAVV